MSSPSYMQLPKKINPNLLGNVKNLPIEEQEKLLNLLKELKDAEDKEQARDGFMPFIKRVWPAFIEGRHHKLSVGFGRKVRNLVDSEDYKDIFPALALRADSKAAGRWSTSKGGEYFAIGVGGAVTGKGADLLIIDDPHSEPKRRSCCFRQGL
mgnify:CR=1 FL=1